MSGVSAKKSETSKKPFAYTVDEKLIIQTLSTTNKGSLRRIRDRVFAMFDEIPKGNSSSAGAGAPSHPGKGGEKTVQEKSSKSLKKEQMTALYNQVPGFAEFNKLSHSERQSDRKGTTLNVGTQNIIQQLLRFDPKIESHTDWAAFCTGVGSGTIQCKLDGLREASLFGDILPSAKAKEEVPTKTVDSNDLPVV